MDKKAIINQAVNEAYKNLTSIAELNVNAIGGYFGLIIPKRKIKELISYSDEIVNLLFKKFCDNIANKITDDDMEFIIYRLFCFNDPSKELMQDCFKIVNDNLQNKKSSNNTTLLESLNSLKPNHSEQELEKSLNTIFDILLDYYLIIKI